MNGNASEAEIGQNIRVEPLKGVVDQPSKESSEPVHRFPYFIDKTADKVLSTKQVHEMFPAEFKQAEDIIEYAQKKIRREPDEPDFNYKIRVMNEVEMRLRFQGDFINKKDEIFLYAVKNLTANRDQLVLMGVEAHRNLLLQEDNERLNREFQSQVAKLSTVPRREVQTGVAHVGEPAYIKADAYEHYFDENGKPLEMPRADMYSLTLVGDRLLDVINPADQSGSKKLSYREQMKKSEEILNNSQSTPEQKRNAASELTSIRKGFYDHMIEAIRTLDKPGHVNENIATQQSHDIVLIQMYKKLNEIRVAGEGKDSTTVINGLIAQYQGVRTGLSEKNKQEMAVLLADRKLSIFDFALKGADLMWRRISHSSVSRVYHEIKPIYHKEREQGPQSLKEVAGIKEPVVVTPAPTEDKTKRKKDDDGEGGDDDHDKNRVKGPDSLTPVPTKEPEKEPIPKPKPEPENPPPAPVPEKKEPLPELETEANLGAAAEQNRATNNVVETAQHVMAHDLARMPRPRYARIPVLGGMLWGIRHPVKLIWQNGIARSVFLQQNIRFSADFHNIIKDAVGTRSIPVNINEELVDKALQGGRELYNQQGAFGRLNSRFRNFLSSVTGISQSSEQIFAKRWLQQQVNGVNPDQWTTNLGINTASIIKDQSAEGDKFADLKGLSLDQANRFLDRGETRHKLEVNPETDAQINHRIKDIIQRYSTGGLTDMQLVQEINNYFVSDDFRNNIPANLRDEFRSQEVATNILSVANKIKDNWNRYQTEKAENGKTKWEEFKMNILYGRGEWGGRRGGTEAGILAESLARRMVNRELMRGTGVLSGAAGLASDILTFGGGYAAGWFAAGAITAPTTLARTLGGAVGASVVATLKETGLRIGGVGWTGRYAKEVAQMSREAALGRKNPAGAHIRAEMEAALVNREKATSLTQNIKSLLDKAELTDADARSLLAALAFVDARLRLTNLSGTAGLNYKTQNYIEYTEGNESQESKELRSVLLDGMVRLQTTSFGSQLYLAGSPTGGIQYHPNGSQQLGLFDKYSAVAEAQLRHSTNDQTMRRWLSRDLRLGDADINSMMSDIYPNLKLNIDRENSLCGKERILNRLTLKRGAAVFARSLVGGAVISPVTYLGVHEIGGLMSHGVGDYLKNWGDVMGGKVPIKDLGNGQFDADLTPIQRGVLQLKSFTEAPNLPIQDVPLHTANIDGIDINMGSGLRNGVLPNGHEYLYDAGGGKLYDLGDLHFGKSDINGDGTMDLVLIDKSGNAMGINDVLSPIKGFKLIESNAVTSEQMILQDTDKLVNSDIVVNGHSIHTQIPEGTLWQQDAQGNWDLVVAGGAGANKLLIDNAHFNAGGNITGSDVMNQALELKTGGARVEAVTGTAAAAEWQKMGTDIHHREWYSYDMKGSQENELQLHTFKDGDSVVLDMSKMGIGKQNGLTPNPINVQDVIKNHQAGFAVSIPGLASKPIWISDGVDGVFDGKVSLNPNDQVHTVALPDGGSITVGDLANMIVNKKALTAFSNGDIATELHSRQDVFNLGNEGKMGFIEAGRLVQQNGNNVLQAFATIRGNGNIAGFPSGGGFSIIDLKEDIKTTIDNSTFTLMPPTSGIDIADLPIIPIPARQNIERSVSEAGATVEVNPESPSKPGAAPTKTPPSDQQNKSTPTPVRSPEDEKEVREKYKQSKEKAKELIEEDLAKINSDKMTVKEFQEKWGVSPESLKNDEKARYKLAQDKYKEQWLATLEVTEEEYENELTADEKEIEEKFLANKKLMENIDREQIDNKIKELGEGKNDEEIAAIGKRLTEEALKKAGLDPKEFDEVNIKYREILNKVHERIMNRKKKEIDDEVARWERELQEAESSTTMPETGNGENVALSIGALQEFANRPKVESKETYEASLKRVMEVLKDQDGIVELRGDVPTIVVPDIHGRREFLLKVMEREVDGVKVYDLLKQGKINVVCVGDGMHTEMPDNWVSGEAGMNEEMKASLGVMKMIMDLKVQFPTAFHYLRGNHDDIVERIGTFSKNANESAQVKEWVGRNFGQGFLDQWGRFESSLPLLAKGKNFVVSHAVAKKPSTEKDIRIRRLNTIENLNWTDNTKMSESALENPVHQTLKNIGMPETSTWIIGHRSTDPDLYRSQLGGQLIQVNNPNDYTLTLVPNDRLFNPDTDVIKI